MPPPSGVEEAPVCLLGAADAAAFLTASNGSSRTRVLDHRFRGSVHNMACIISIHCGSAAATSSSEATGLSAERNLEAVHMFVTMVSRVARCFGHD